MISARTSAIAAVAFLALGATLASGEEDKATKVDGSDAKQQQTEFKVGDTVKLGDWQVKVNQVTDPFTPSNDFITPAAGKRFVRVDTEEQPEQEAAGRVLHRVLRPA
ncbi:MAG: hypothetical protein QM658_02785 [Gordonia sp. (in: high G+C Gram-positive bacteria)]